MSRPIDADALMQNYCGAGVDEKLCEDYHIAAKRWAEVRRMSEKLFVAYIWLDDDHPFGVSIQALHDYDCYAVHSVNEAKYIIESCEAAHTRFILDIDNDLGDYTKDGGDGYRLVEWLIETGRNTNNYQVCCHSMNPVGRRHILGLRDQYWKPFNEEEFFNV